MRTPHVAGVLNGILGWNLKQSGWRFGALNVCQRVSGLTHAKIIALGKNRYLQVRRVPGFACGYDRLCVAHGSRWNCMGHTLALCIHAADVLRAQIAGNDVRRTLRSKAPLAVVRFTVRRCACRGSSESSPHCGLSGRVQAINIASYRITDKCDRYRTILGERTACNRLLGIRAAPAVTSHMTAVTSSDGV